MGHIANGQLLSALGKKNKNEISFHTSRYFLNRQKDEDFITRERENGVDIPVI